MVDIARAPEVVVDLDDPALFVNRELSWLEFNDRVLAQAQDPETPLLERVKFLAICTNNLDEFYMVRFAGLKRQAAAGVTRGGPDGLSPAEALTAIDARTEPMTEAANDLFNDVLRPALSDAGIHILSYVDLDTEDQRHLRRIFHDQIFPVLTPLAVDPGHPFPYISNLSLSLALFLRDPDSGRELFARVKVPVGMLPRLVRLPGEGFRFVPIEDVIAAHLEFLFPGMDILGCHLFRVTRNADLVLEEDAGDDLLAAIELGLKQRRFGEVVRLEVAEDMPQTMIDLLVLELEVSPADVFPCRALLGLNDLFELASLDGPDLRDPPWTSRVPPRFRPDEDGRIPDLFAALRQGDLLVHHPYDSFTRTVEAFIQQAAHDPLVVAIKMTLYRTGGGSQIVPALIDAADQGKQVAVLVEVKARFDEEANIAWARELERAGVHVVYGLVGLKTHAKVALVIRREGDGIRRYFHVGTGNYNPRTASLYTDLGLLSCRDDIGADITDLFNYLTGYSRQRSYRRLLVAPLTLRNTMLELIERETAHAKVAQPAAIDMKLNSLVDPEMIKALYRASQAGVVLRLNVRGICCLRPGVTEVSDTVSVVSVVDRFLEHARVFRFENAGQPEFYVGSADLMQRNLDGRVEALVPVDDPDLQEELDLILDLTFADNRSAWDMHADGSWTQRRPAPGEPVRRVQQILMSR